MGKCSLSEDEDIHIGVTKMVLSSVVYGKFCFWLGCDFVGSFV